VDGYNWCVLRRYGRLAALLAVAVVLTATSASSAPARPQHKGPPNKAWHRCHSWIVSGPAHLTGFTYVRIYGPKGSSTVTQHYVRVRNMNVLGWVGDVTVDNYQHPRMWLYPGKSHWIPSPALIVNRSKVGFSIDIDPVSDATSLSVELFAGRCTPYH
jgi:hypothetical protein